MQRDRRALPRRLLALRRIGQYAEVGKAVMAKHEHGWVYIGMNLRPFNEYRQITKGHKKGQYEVIVGKRKFVVTENMIKSFPLRPVDLSAS